jgi:hypothetical protein
LHLRAVSGTLEACLRPVEGKFMSRRRFGLLIALLLTVWCASTAAQTDRPIATIMDGNLWLYSIDGIFARQVTSSGGYSNPVWSPDGTLLAYTGNPDGAGVKLYLVDQAGLGTPVVLANGLNTPFPISFTPDSSQVVYAQVADGGNTVPQRIDVFAVAPRAGAPPLRLGTFDYRGGCGGGGTIDPSEFRYSAETNQPLGYNTPVMHMTAFGLLHSTSCLDDNQLVVLDVNTGTVAPLPVRGDAFVSTDGTIIVVPGADRLNLISDPTRPITEIRISGTPDRIGFGGEGDIYYSTRAFVAQTPMPADIRDRVGEVLYLMPLSYEISLFRFNLRNGVNERLYTESAYGIGRLGGTFDGETLIFSQIPNPDFWVNALAQGTLSLDEIDGAGFYDFVDTEIYALNLADKSVQPIADGWRWLAVNPALVEPVATPTLPPTLTPVPPEAPTLSPSGLAAGVEATVSEVLVALNVRENPGTGARVVEIILPGDRVTILDGPIFMEGFTWWEVRVEESTAVGWAVEQVGNTYTMIP